MEIQGKLSDEEVFKAIENNMLIRMMKGITEDEAYSNDEKYVILEGMLSAWENGEIKKP